MSSLVHVLVVDDEPRIRTMLRRYLVEEGFKVSDAADGSAMRAALEGGSIHCVLLDLMMPGEDGLSLARYIRQRSDIPIIMLTGKGDLIDRVVGLEAGADDYITKPFELREVLARIRTVMRRAAPPPAPATPPLRAAGSPKDEILVFQGWRLDSGAARARTAHGRERAADRRRIRPAMRLRTAPQSGPQPQPAHRAGERARLGGL